jgi:hypothetical protein
LDDDKMRRFQMPLTGENFKRDNKLVSQMLKSACIKSDAWTLIQSFDALYRGWQESLACSRLPLQWHGGIEQATQKGQGRDCPLAVEV